MMGPGIEKSVRRGYLFVIAAALLWAISGSSAKFLFHSGVTPFQLVQLRLTLSVGVLVGILAVARPVLLRISMKDIPYFILFGAVGMAGVQFTYLFAISKINVAAAILLEYLAPFFIVIYAAVFQNEKPGGATLTALVIAFAGCYLVVGAYDLDLLSMNLSGVLSGLGAAVTFAWYGIFGEYGMRRYDPWTVLVFALVFATGVWNVAHPPLEAFSHDYNWVQWGWILFIALFGTLVPFGLYLKGVNLIRAARAGITATLEPIAAGILSAVFLNEILSPLQIFGGVLVITAIILLQLKQEYDEKAPAVIRARALESEIRSSKTP